jgi:hypothetical protein
MEELGKKEKMLDKKMLGKNVGPKNVGTICKMLY